MINNHDYDHDDNHTPTSEIQSGHGDNNDDEQEYEDGDENGVDDDGGGVDDHHPHLSVLQRPCYSKQAVDHDS